jgi:deoxyribodipyrimidine photo-lyase
VYPIRVRSINREQPKKGGVIYWMSRDQRVRDNWALLHAQKLALKAREALAVVFCLVPEFLHATIRQYGFMLRGLEEVEHDLAKRNIPFFLLTGAPEKILPRFLRTNRVGMLVTDFDPLRMKLKWRHVVARIIDIPFSEVDAHNIVPCWAASSKQEYGAYTIRPKIKRLLPEFLTEFSVLKRHPFTWQGKTEPVDWAAARKNLNVDTDVPEVDWLTPGEKAAHKALHRFIQHKLSRYAEDSNNPALDAQSNLSPYLHFGQLSAQRIALLVIKSLIGIKSKGGFLEELIIRRELSDNFCFYNSNYDNVGCFPAWARESLQKHQKDRREYVYTLKEFEEGRTHDNLWNAAQMEMKKRGKMHGYIRMYWAKKILQWSESPGKAMKIAIYLNDKYELDGRDPNGYVGIAWSIGGVHDRAWGERPVFGKIRYMSYNGCRSKFDVEAYIEQITNH